MYLSVGILDIFEKVVYDFNPRALTLRTHDRNSFRILGFHLLTLCEYVLQSWDDLPVRGRITISQREQTLRVRVLNHLRRRFCTSFSSNAIRGGNGLPDHARHSRREISRRRLSGERSFQSTHRLGTKS